MLIVKFYHRYDFYIYISETIIILILRKKFVTFKIICVKYKIV